MAMNLKDEILGGESPVLEFKRDIPEYTDWGNAVRVTVRRLPKIRGDTLHNNETVTVNDIVNDTVNVSLNNLLEKKSSQTPSNNETLQAKNVALKSGNVSLHDAIVAFGKFGDAWTTFEMVAEVEGKVEI